MRILHLAPPATAHNGIAAYANRWREAMTQAGAQISSPSLEQPVAALDAQLQQLQPDWIHAELGGGRGLEFAALQHLARRQPQLRCSATVHDPERLIWRAATAPAALAWLQNLPSPAPQLVGLLDHRRVLGLERKLAQRLNAVVCMTQRGSQALAQRMQLSSARSYTIAHGVSTYPSRPLPTGPLRLLYFGYIYPGKGIEDLLQALAGLHASGLEHTGPTRLTLAGGSAPEMTFGGSGGYIQSLRQQIQQLGLQAYVDWQIDLPESAIAELIQAHHVMVLPYRESWKLAWLGRMLSTSGALAWAIACGRGAIVSDARAFGEEISHGNGCQFRHRDPRDLQQQLARLACQPELAQHWAEHAAVLAVERQWPRIAEQYIEMFNHAAESSTDA